MPFADHPWNQKIRVTKEQKKRDLKKHSEGVDASVGKTLAEVLNENPVIDLSKLSNPKGK